jgi:hypothetical protein
VNTYTVNRKHCLPLGYHSAPPCVRKAMREASHVDVATFTDKAEALQHAEALHVATGCSMASPCTRTGACMAARWPRSISRTVSAGSARARMSGGEG